MRLILLVFLLTLSACLGTVEGDAIPQHRLVFPSALLQNQYTLYVLNSNLDLQYKTGSISQIDLPTGKITRIITTPSLAGQMVSNADFSVLITTSQHTNSLESPLSGSSLSLQYNAPYFLALYTNQAAGLVGYLTLPTNEPWDQNRFSIVANQPELQYFTYDSTGEIQIKTSFQIATCFKAPARSYRRIARIGGISIKENNTYILIEFIIDDPADSNKFSKRVFLIRTANSLIQNGTLCNDQTAILDITNTEKAQAARGIEVSNDEQTAYVLLDENPLLATINLSADKTPIAVSQRIATCKRPSTLKLSKDDKTVVVACSRSNELVAYNVSNLGLFGMITAEEKPGIPLIGGPLDILFDQTPNSKQIFVSYQQDHRVGKFEYENSPSSSRYLRFIGWLELSR